MKQEREYEPFGDEWVKEVMKTPKKFIIEKLYKPTAIRAKMLEEKNAIMQDTLRKIRLEIKTQ